MARPKSKRRSVPAAQEQPTDWLPLAALAGLMGGFLLAYLAAEMAFYLRPHPLHWLIATLGGGAGYAGGLVWDRLGVR